MKSRAYIKKLRNASLEMDMKMSHIKFHNDILNSFWDILVQKNMMKIRFLTLPLCSLVTENDIYYSSYHQVKYIRII